MRCASCGLPLSPSRTHCPRCGAAKGSASSHIQSNASSQQRGTIQVGEVSKVSKVSTLGAEFPQQHAWEAYTPPAPFAPNAPPAPSAPSTPWEMQGEMPFAQHMAPMAFQASDQDADEQLPFPPASNPFGAPSDTETVIQPQGGAPEPGAGRPDLLWLPPPSVAAPQMPSQASDWLHQIQRRMDSHEQQIKQAVPFLFTTDGERRPAKFGLSIASLCVMVGGLILVFVHFMALGLSPIASEPGPQPTRLAVHATPTLARPTPSPTATMAPAFPGQQFIDNAQMASAVSGGLPTQVTTDFKVSQQINVTFMVHPAGQSGAVCLLWYLNSQEVTQYAFQVGAYRTARPASSYAILGGAGTGTVELYWASTTACADKQLAQRLTFNVS